MVDHVTERLTMHVYIVYTSSKQVCKVLVVGIALCQCFIHASFQLPRDFAASTPKISCAACTVVFNMQCQLKDGPISFTVNTLSAVQAEGLDTNGTCQGQDVETCGGAL